MGIRRMAILFVALSLVFSFSDSGATDVRQFSAIVTAVSGESTVKAPSGQAAPLRLFTRIEPGSTIGAGKGSRVTIAFTNGTRFELGEGARATITADGVRDVSGSVKPLPAVPPLPRLAALDTQRDGARAGAIRIRGQNITGMIPRPGASTIADRTTLGFNPVEAAATYKVEIEDDRGVSVFEVETDKSSVAVSPGVLKPGRSYYWRVKAIAAIGPSVRGESDFTTLEADEVARRDALRSLLIERGDAASLALASEIDRGLGLIPEALETVKLARQKSAGDPALAAALDDIERQLENR
jgi:hypothetical protein